MKKALFNQLMVAVLCLTSFATLAETENTYERKIVVVIASYNNARWHKGNLLTVFFQDYSNYRVIYVDDCSPDGTGNLAEQYIKSREQNHRVTLIKNKVRKRALENIYNAIWMCEDDEIVVILDGDDFFPNERVLSTINEVYSDPSVWLTFGQYCTYPGKILGFNKAIPDEVIRKNAIRGHDRQPSHLRTFYAKLFKNIKKEDLLYNGEFFPMTYDLAIMMPMMEMVGFHHKFIDKILYLYNDENPINDHKVNKDLQRTLDKEIRSRKPYEPLESLFEEQTENQCDGVQCRI